MGVFLVYADPRGHALLDRKPYLPQAWTRDLTRQLRYRSGCTWRDMDNFMTNEPKQDRSRPQVMVSVNVKDVSLASPASVDGTAALDGGKQLREFIHLSQRGWVRDSGTRFGPAVSQQDGRTVRCGPSGVKRNKPLSSASEPKDKSHNNGRRAAPGLGASRRTGTA